MLADERREVVLQAVNERGSVRVTDLVDQLGISAMTARRDIARLADEGRLRRVYGGGVRLPAATPRAVARQSGPDSGAESLARAAVAHIAAGSFIGLAAGDLAPSLARALCGMVDVVVVTNSLAAADVLDGAPGVSVVLTGGVRTAAGALVGPVAVGSLATLNLQELLLPAEALDARAGITASGLLEAETQRAMIAAARRVRVVAASHRLRHAALFAVAPAAAVHALVTDCPAREVPAALVQVVGELVTVPTRDGCVNCASSAIDEVPWLGGEE